MTDVGGTTNTYEAQSRNMINICTKYGFDSLIISGSYGGHRLHMTESANFLLVCVIDQPALRCYLHEENNLEQVLFTMEKPWYYRGGGHSSGKLELLTACQNYIQNSV